MRTKFHIQVNNDVDAQAEWMCKAQLIARNLLLAFIRGGGSGTIDGLGLYRVCDPSWFEEEMNRVWFNGARWRGTLFEKEIIKKVRQNLNSHNLICSPKRIVTDK